MNPLILPEEREYSQYMNHNCPKCQSTYTTRCLFTNGVWNWVCLSCGKTFL